MKRIFYILLSAISLIAFSRCTDNTVFDDKIGEADQRTVSGTVLFDDNNEPSDIVVWSKEMDISTRTDSLGNFTLRFPPPDLQPGAGYNGYTNLYFYMGNYKIERASILMMDGEIQYGQADVTAQGKLAHTVQLKKLIEISTSISPSSIPADFSNMLIITTHLFAPNDSVTVQSFKHQSNDAMFTNVFFKRPDEANEDAFFWRKSALSRIKNIRGHDEWFFPVHSDSITLPPGEYDVIPYILILQDAIPVELVSSFGIIPNIYDNSYLNIPFRQKYGHLTVTDSLGR